MDFKVFINGSEFNLTDNHLVFQGYINHQNRLLYDDRASDVLKEQVEANGIEELFRTVNGAFRFIYLKEDILWFSVDHIGGYTLFYKILDGNLALFDNPMLYPGHKLLNDPALCSIMAAGYTIGESTFFDQIMECKPGVLYAFNTVTGILETRVWYRHILTDSNQFSAEKLNAVIETLFPVTDDREYTVSLSGGIDSRFLVGCLLNKDRPFQTYSFGSEFNSDSHIASELATKLDFLNLRHQFTPEICRQYYSPADIDFIIKNCTLGRSLPNETDLISSRLLDPEKHIITKGFSGDVLAGSLITGETLRIKTFKALVDYVFNKHFRLTPFSGGSFKAILYSGLKENLRQLYDTNGQSIISALDEWHLLHRQRKYIVNTLAFYKAAGFMIYLPFYDRRLMDYFASLRLFELQNQKAYFNYLRDNYFSARLSPLRETVTSRQNFKSPDKQDLAASLLKKLRQLVSKVDSGNYLKRFLRPSTKFYADSLMLLTGEAMTLPFLSNKIGTNYPAAFELSSFLQANGCPEAARHLNWLTNQATIQMHINGLSLGKFFFSREFKQNLEEHIAT